MSTVPTPSRARLRSTAARTDRALTVAISWPLKTQYLDSTWGGAGEG